MDNSKTLLLAYVSCNLISKTGDFYNPELSKRFFCYSKSPRVTSVKSFWLLGEFRLSARGTFGTHLLHVMLIIASDCAGLCANETSFIFLVLKLALTRILVWGFVSSDLRFRTIEFSSLAKKGKTVTNCCFFSPDVSSKTNI